MTQKDKELLLQDLCSRLPYGIKIWTKWDKNPSPLTVSILGNYWYTVGNDIKPYLRSMSSMTTEEKKEILNLLGYNVYICEDFSLLADSASHIIQRTLIQTYVDWLNAHYFDYRGLIEKGLALEAPKGIYES